MAEGRKPCSPVAADNGNDQTENFHNYNDLFEISHSDVSELWITEFASIGKLKTIKYNSNFKNILSFKVRY